MPSALVGAGWDERSGLPVPEGRVPAHPAHPGVVSDLAGVADLQPFQALHRGTVEQPRVQANRDLAHPRIRKPGHQKPRSPSPSGDFPGAQADPRRHRRSTRSLATCLRPEPRALRPCKAHGPRSLSPRLAPAEQPPDSRSRDSGQVVQDRAPLGEAARPKARPSRWSESV